MDCILTDNEIRPKIGYHYTDCRLFHGVVYYSNLNRKTMVTYFKFHKNILSFLDRVFKYFFFLQTNVVLKIM